MSSITPSEKTGFSLKTNSRQSSLNLKSLSASNLTNKDSGQTIILNESADFDFHEFGFIEFSEEKLYNYCNNDLEIKSNISGNYNESSGRAQLLAGFDPEKLRRPIDTDHICDVFLKCRIMLADYLSSNQLNENSKLSSDKRNEKEESEQSKSRRLARIKGRGILSKVSRSKSREINSPNSTLLTPYANVPKEQTEDAFEIKKANQEIENKNSLTIIDDIKQNSNKPIDTKLQVSTDDVKESVNSSLISQDVKLSVKNNLTISNQKIDISLNTNEMNSNEVPFVSKLNNDLPEKLDSPNAEMILPAEDISDLKFNFKYNDVFYRLTIKTENTVNDLKQIISEKLNIPSENIGLSFTDGKPKNKMIDNMNINEFNSFYKNMFYVVNLEDEKKIRKSAESLRRDSIIMNNEVIGNFISKNEVSKSTPILMNSKITTQHEVQSQQFCKEGTLDTNLCGSLNNLSTNSLSNESSFSAIDLLIKENEMFKKKLFNLKQQLQQSNDNKSVRSNSSVTSSRWSSNNKSNFNRDNNDPRNLNIQAQKFTPINMYSNQEVCEYCCSCPSCQYINQSHLRSPAPIFNPYTGIYTFTNVNQIPEYNQPNMNHPYGHIN